jgi:hypothetical protein
MKLKYTYMILLIATSSVSIGQTFKKIVNTATEAGKTITKSSSSAAPLSNEEVIKGLKEALTVGANNSTALASKVDGFYKNAALFIPFPKEAIKMKQTLDGLGLKTQTDKFVMTLNRAAEEAAKNAAPVFINAIKNMTIADGFAILKGGDSAATNYLRSKTTEELRQKFSPVVQAAINKVELTKYWNPLASEYNKIPFVQKQNPDLTAYVTDRAMLGLFKLVAAEELKIRKDPVSRVTNLLKRVFGSV